MSDKDKIQYPSVIASDAGAPAGTMNVHDQATGQTVNVEATTSGLQDAMRQFNQK